MGIFIEQQYIQIPDEPILIDELESFGYQLTEGGNIRYSAPTGYHDDAVISLGLAVWGLEGKVNIKPPLQEELEKVKKPKIKETFI